MTLSPILGSHYGSRARTWLGLVLAIAIFQLLYWMAINPLKDTVPVTKSMVHTNFSVASLDSPSLESAQSAVYETAVGPWSGCCTAPAYYAIRFNINLDERPAGDYGVVTQQRADNFHIYVNGYVVRDSGTLGPQTSFHGQLREISRVSAGLLRAGDNEILVLTARRAYEETSFTLLIFGDYVEMMAFGNARLFFWNQLSIASAGIALALAFVSLFLIRYEHRRKFGLALLTLAGALALRNSFYFWYDFPFGDALRAIYYFALTILVAIGWVAFINEWTEKPIAWVRGTSASIALATILVVAAFFTNEYTVAYGYSTKLTDLVTGISAVASLALLTHHLWNNQEDRSIAVGALVLGVTLTIADVYGYAFHQINYGHQDRAAFFVLLGLSISLVSRNIRLFESMNAISKYLNGQLEEREQEIRHRYEDLQEAIRARDIADERQRIMRDMHDGVGGQLMSLATRARRGNLANEDLTHFINTTLADLRLMIDSLDSVGDSLDMVLAKFQDRIRPMIESHGAQLAWRNRLEKAGPEYSQRDLLNIQRTLLEAVSNALNHGQPENLCIEIREDGGEITIEVVDDGAGFDQDQVSTGRGLNNMRQRMRAVGGECVIQSKRGGPTHVRLILPHAAAEPTRSVAQADLPTEPNGY